MQSRETNAEADTATHPVEDDVVHFDVAYADRMQHPHCARTPTDEASSSNKQIRPGRNIAHRSADVTTTGATGRTHAQTRRKAASEEQQEEHVDHSQRANREHRDRASAPELM